MVAGRDGELLPRHGAARHAGHVGAVLSGDDVIRAGLQQVTGDLLGPDEHLLGGGQHGVAGRLQRPRAHGAGAAGHGGGVGVDEPDLLHRDAEHVAGHHGERGVVALAVGAGADRHRRRAVLVDLDRAVLGVQAERERSLRRRSRCRSRVAPGRRRPAGGPARPAARRSRRRPGPRRAPWRTRRSRTMPPVVVVSGKAAGSRKLRRRISAGSMPSWSAATSRTRSISWVASGRPAPR